jgi:hypothetical protein
MCMSTHHSLCTKTMAEPRFHAKRALACECSGACVFFIKIATFKLICFHIDSFAPCFVFPLSTEMVRTRKYIRSDKRKGSGTSVKARARGSNTRGGNNSNNSKGNNNNSNNSKGNNNNSNNNSNNSKDKGEEKEIDHIIRMIRKNPTKVSKQALGEVVRWCAKNPKKALGVVAMLAYTGVYGARGVGAAARGHGAAASDAAALGIWGAHNFMGRMRKHFNRSAGVCATSELEDNVTSGRCSNPSYTDESACKF